MEVHNEMKQELWNEGANYTADPVIVTDDGYVLLIRRMNGKLALPGGFVDDGEVSAEHAARREAFEEAGITLTQSDTLIYNGRVDDERNTATRWIETSAYLYNVPTVTELDPDYSEVLEALWVHIDNIPDELYGSHTMLIEAAKAKRWPLSSLLTERNYEHSAAQGGHMGYKRMIATHPAGRPSIFIKQHSADHFSDTEREYHSLQYLRKEANVYEWLGDKAAHIIPEVHEYADDALLMNAYTEHDGWRWRAPKDTLERKRYIQDVIAAAITIGTLMHDTSIEHGVRNTHVSIEREGWSAYSTKSEHIKNMLSAYGESAAELLYDLDALYDSSIRIDSTPTAQFAHHDFRQSNIAWHPENGVRVVDWSWAGPGFGGDDTTSLLIDLNKSGYDIGDQLALINPDHALRLMGFWLCHAVDEPAPGNNNVREQQLLSAIAAHRVRRMILETRVPDETAS